MKYYVLLTAASSKHFLSDPEDKAKCLCLKAETSAEPWPWTLCLSLAPNLSQPPLS